MNTDDMTQLICQALPGAAVTVDDVRGDGRHYAVVVTAPQFAGQSRIQQHQLVYKALGACVGEDVHALQLTTRVPGEATAARAQGAQ